MSTSRTPRRRRQENAPHNAENAEGEGHGWLNRLMGKHRVVGNKSSEKVARKSVAPKKANGSQFFAEQAVTELESWSDFRLEEVGCPTEPIRWGSVSDRVSISWAEIFAALGAEFKAPSSVVFYACAELRSKRLYSKRLVCISSWRACTATTRQRKAAYDDERSRNHGVGVGDLIVRSKGAWFASLSLRRLAN